MRQVILDTETTGLDYMDADLVGISISYEPGQAAYIPISHEDDSSPQLEMDYVLQELRPLLEDSNEKIIGQNIKFDKNILARYGINISSIKNDTMMMSYVLDASATRHNLDALSSYYLNYKTSTFEDVAGKGVKQVTFSWGDGNLKVSQNVGGVFVRFFVSTRTIVSTLLLVGVNHRVR